MNLEFVSITFHCLAFATTVETLTKDNLKINSEWSKKVAVFVERFIIFME